jgi:hypothetical protein
MIQNKFSFPVLTISDVGRACGLTDVAIYKHVHDSHIDVVRLPGCRQFFVEPAALAAFLKARAEGRYVRPEKRSAIKQEAV